MDEVFAKLKQEALATTLAERQWRHYVALADSYIAICSTDLNLRTPGIEDKPWSRVRSVRADEITVAADIAGATRRLKNHVLIVAEHEIGLTFRWSVRLYDHETGEFDADVYRRMMKLLRSSPNAGVCRSGLSQVLSDLVSEVQTVAGVQAKLAHVAGDRATDAVQALLDFGIRPFIGLDT